MPEVRCDNGSCYISRDFRGVLDEHGLTHNRIKPHCPEENGTMERANRTFREALDGEELTDLYQARDVMKRTSTGTTANDCIQRSATCGRSITTGAIRTD